MTTKQQRIKSYKDNPDIRESLYERAKDHPEEKAHIEMVARCYDVKGIQNFTKYVDELDRRKLNENRENA